MDFFDSYGEIYGILWLLSLKKDIFSDEFGILAQKILLLRQREDLSVFDEMIPED